MLLNVVVPYYCVTCHVCNLLMSRHTPQPLVCNNVYCAQRRTLATACRPVTCVGHPNDNLHNSTLSVHSALFPCHILSLGQVGIL